MLRVLGLADDEDTVYRALVARPGVGAADLARALAESAAGPQPGAAAGPVWTERRVAAVLRGLCRAGLAVAEDGPEGEPSHRATPPELALEPLITARRDDLRQAEAVVARLAGEYRAAHTVRPGAPVEVVRGREAVRHRFLQLQLAAQREVLGFAPYRGQRHVVSAEENSAEAEAMRRGVCYRVVVERASLDHGDLLAEALGVGQEITVVDSLPVQLVIADGRIGMVPLTPIVDGADPGAVIIHEGGLLEALVALFHAYRKQGWRLVGPEQARPGAEPAEEPDEVDRSILGLLNIGLTDASIARQLGLGYRTVQRRISRLMDMAGAQTRFQLGSRASHVGWLGAVEDRPVADHRRAQAAAERSDNTELHG